LCDLVLVPQLQEELGRSRDVARELRLRIKTLEADLEAARSSSGGGGAVGVAATAGRGGYRRPAAADRCVLGGWGRSGCVWVGGKTAVGWGAWKGLEEE
jgi:hypothetical protein